MNKTNAIQCESCTEPTKHLVFCDAENESWNRWMCQNTDCQYNDMAEKQKSATEKRKEAQEINRKNCVDVKKLVKLRIRAQLNLVEAAEIVGVRTAQYSAWERERELFPVDKYNELLKRFKQEISNHKCGNCQFYNGNESDIESFCDKLEDETQRDCVCERYMKRW